MKSVVVKGVFIGKSEEIGTGLCSAVDKHLIEHRQWLWPQGFGNDDQGDARFHGGLDRALHHYPAEHYQHWQQVYSDVLWTAPAFGENISSLGLRESQVCIGDIFRWGEALLQVSQPRSPCYRLSYQWKIPGLPQRAQDSGRCGWYYRVLKPGYVSPQDPLELVQRVHPGLTVARVLSHFYHQPMERSGLQQLVQCSSLSHRWREIAAQRLATNQLEDWQERLHGVAPEGVLAVQNAVLAHRLSSINQLGEQPRHA